MPTHRSFCWNYMRSSYIPLVLCDYITDPESKVHGPKMAPCWPHESCYQGKYTARQLYWITILVPSFCLTAGGNLRQYQYKAPDHIQRPLADLWQHTWSTITLSVPVSLLSWESWFPPITPKGSVPHHHDCLDSYSTPEWISWKYTNNL